MRTGSGHGIYSTSIGMGNPTYGLANRDEPKLHLSTTAAHWSPPAYQAALIALGAVMVGQALTMARRGPATGLTVPAGFETTPAPGATTTPAMTATSR